jgi:hypothetical protein
VKKYQGRKPTLSNRHSCYSFKLPVTALLIERVAELKCKEPWSRIGRALKTLQLSEFRTPENQFFQRNEASQELGRILKSLEIPMPKVVLNVSSATADT